MILYHGSNMSFQMIDLVKRENMAPDMAMDYLYHSRFFEKLTNPDTCLYRESAEYLYHSLKANS